MGQIQIRWSRQRASPIRQKISQLKSSKPLDFQPQACSNRLQDFTLKVIQTIAAIPAGQVATYGQIAAMAGNHRAARQVSRILHTCTSKYQLPWHRVIGSAGKISIPKDQSGYLRQKKKLQQEGVEFGLSDTIDLSLYQWPG